MVARRATAADQTVFQFHYEGLRLALTGDGFVGDTAIPSQRAAGANLSVDTTAATFRIAGTQYTAVAANTAVNAAHATLPRTDLIYADSAGIKYLSGTAAAAPSATVLYPDPPDLPASSIPIALVEVGAAVTTITDSRIVDCRWEIALDRDLVDAKGDLLAGTAADTVARHAAGADGTVLGFDAAQSDGLANLARSVVAQLADVAATEAAGTNTTVPFGDHVHAHGSGYLPDAHHAQSHVLATGTALGPDHTVSGAAAGEVLRALGATTAAFDVLAHADLGTVTSDQHHAQAHATAHQPAGADAMAVDAAQGTGSLRTVGGTPTTSAVGDAAAAGAGTQAAATNHVHGREAFATPAIVLGTAAAAGAATTPIRSDSTIVAFDATVPVTQAFSDAAATGSVAISARRDHRHGMPAAPAGGFDQACRVYNSANISVASDTDVVITFDSERFDTDTMHSTASNTGRITFTTAGVYVVGGGFHFPANATGGAKIRVRLNGTTEIGRPTFDGNDGSTPAEFCFSLIYKFAAADYIEFVAYQTSGVALNCLFIANDSPEAWAAKVATG